MKTRIIIVISLALIGCPLLAQESWKTKYYRSLADGNELYSECQSAQENIRHQGDGTQLKTSAEPDALVSAGMCLGYIKAVVDSIPAGEGFEPDANVKLSQDVDVVLAYLHDNPNRRHFPAYGLSRTALSDAFPGKTNR